MSIHDDDHQTPEPQRTDQARHQQPHRRGLAFYLWWYGIEPQTRKSKTDWYVRFTYDFMWILLPTGSAAAIARAAGLCRWRGGRCLHRVRETQGRAELRRTALIALVAFALGCGPNASRPRSVAAAVAPGLQALAREVDPGPVDDVGTTLNIEPERHGNSVTSAHRLARGRKVVAEFVVYAKQERLDYPQGLGERLLSSIADIELLAAKDEAARARSCALLIEAYGVFTAVIFAAHFPEQMAHLNGTQSELSADAKKGLGLSGRETALRRRAAACVLQAGGTPEELALALDVAGRHLAEQGDAFRARELHEDALRRRGDSATAIDWLRVASSRAAALAPAEARAAFARARQLEARLPPVERAAFLGALTRGEARIRDAERASKIADSKDREDEITFVLLLEKLRPARAVRPLLVALERKYPDDARPIVTLARLRLEEDSFDPAVVRDAENIARRAEATNNRPREYWDLLLAVAANDLTRAVAAPSTSKEEILARMNANWGRILGLARGISELDPGKAQTLALVEEILRIVIQPAGDSEKRVRELLVAKADVFEQLGARHAASPEVARAMMLIGSGLASTSDVARAFRFAGRDITEAGQGEEALVLEQLRVFLSLAARHPTYLAQFDTLLVKAAKGPPTSPQPRADIELIEADYLAVLWKSEDKHHLTGRAATLYSHAADSLPAAGRARALSNLAAVRLAAGGTRGGPAQLIDEAIALQPKSEYAMLNRLVLGALDRKGGVERELETFAADASKRSEPRAIALAWVAKLAQERRDPVRAASAAAEAMAMTKGALPLERGLLFDGSLSVGITYAPSSPRLHRIPLSIKTDLWLVLAPAMPDAELKALAASAPGSTPIGPLRK